MDEISIDQLMRKAFGFHQSGQFAQAEELYNQILSRKPDHVDALHMLGVLARQTGRLDASVDLICRALAVNPNLAEAHNNLGNVLRQQKKLDQAIPHYRRAVQIKPDWPEAYGSFGNALRDLGLLDDAVAAYTRCIQLQPNLVPAYINLGNVLCDQNKYDDAIAIYNAAIGINPNVAEAHNNLGNAYWEMKRVDEALAAYVKAVQLRPGYPEANWSAGKILSSRGQNGEALTYFQRAVDLNAGNAAAHLNLGRMFMRAGESQRGIEAYREAIRLNPSSADWKFELAALIGDSTVQTAPASYVKNLFDTYAPTFDKHLLENLAYKTPDHLRGAILKATRAREFDVLDLGCGTGLCGEKIKPYARRLVGVDLSRAMIERAKSRKIYDELIVDELLPVLRRSSDQYDLIIAGDVLVYVGDLTELILSVAAALRHGGIFAFSVENYDGDGYFLTKYERFAHSMNYIRKLAANAGLRELFAEKVALRKHRDGEIVGRIVLLAKDTVD